MNDMRAMLERAAERIAPNTIVDIGASDGRWARIAHDVWPAAQFLCIEANPVHAPGLAQFCAETNSRYCMRLAGPRSCTVFCVFNQADPFSGIRVLNHDDETTGAVRTSCTTVDEELRSSSLQPPYLIKFDTHGMENLILEGAMVSLRETVGIVMECYTWKQDQPRALRFCEMCFHLKGLGFLPSDLCDPLWRPYDGRLSQVDMLFERELAKGVPLLPTRRICYLDYIFGLSGLTRSPYPANVRGD